ncbi:MAG: extracellular solute-binding protein [Phycisphaerales bacterium]|nr:extracellular solute-binding protein [Phycisphaerales bacterium]
MSRTALYCSVASVVVLTMTPVLAYRGTPRRSTERTLVIVTPHNEQIREEFSSGFIRWHEREYGEAVSVAWNTPGGTTEIRRMLIAQYESAMRHNQPVGGDADILFGGGSYEYETLSRPLKVVVDGSEHQTTILQPCDWLTPQALDEIYGHNAVDGRPIYDAKLHWFGVALSSFGIVSNTQQCAEHSVEVPDRWADLADPRFFEAVALVNPAQSGSVATAFETILQRLGWKRGWQVLRRAAANSNQITASSSVTPTTVADGESWTGIAIDFYGRYEVQSLSDEAVRTGIATIDRLSFCTPKGESVVDADPVAILRGAPNPELAKRFVQFCLSMEGQMLWQLPHGEGDLCGYPRPRQYSLRRMPARRAAYDCCKECFMDQINPFEDQAPLVSDRNFRSFVAPLFVPLAMTHTDLLREAWHAIITHPSYPKGGAVVSAEDVTDPVLKDWLTAFDALPMVAGPGGTSLDMGDPAALSAVRNGWLKGQFAGENLWQGREQPTTMLRRQFNAFFERQYQHVIDSAHAEHDRAR